MPTMIEMLRAYIRAVAAAALVVVVVVVVAVVAANNRLLVRTASGGCDHRASIGLRRRQCVL